MKNISLVIASLLLAGCARTTPMALGPDHPASPDAPVAPVPPPSTTLAVSAPPTALPRPDSHTPSHERHRAGHADHGGHAGAQPHRAEPATTRAHVQATYICPMHPEVVSKEPGRCPKCKMKLVRKEGAR